MRLGDLNVGDKIKVGNYTGYIGQNNVLYDDKSSLICDNKHTIILIPFENKRGFIQDKQKTKDMCSNYEYSIMRQWLNSNSKYSWFSKSYSEQQAEYDTNGGFLSELPKLLLDNMDRFPNVKYKPTTGGFPKYLSNSELVAITSEQEMCSPSVGKPDNRLAYFKQHTLSDLLSGTNIKEVSTRTLKDEDTYVEVNSTGSTTYSFCYNVHNYIIMLYVKDSIDVAAGSDGYVINAYKLEGVPITIEGNQILYKFITENKYKYTMYLNDSVFVTNNNTKNDTRYYITFDQLDEYWNGHDKIEMKVVGSLVEKPDVTCTLKGVFTRTTSNLDNIKKVVVKDKIYHVESSSISGLDKYKLVLKESTGDIFPSNKATLFSNDLKVRYTTENKGALTGFFGDKVSEIAKDNSIKYKYSNQIDNPTNKVSYSLSADNCHSNSANIRSIGIAFNYHSDKE